MKAVLVIDMPDDMEISETYIVGVTLYNGIFTKDISMQRSLRPLPQEKHGGEVVLVNHRYYHFDTEYQKGWNDCLDEITGEIE